MQSTRQHILDTLEQSGSASARQLALVFGMTAANLRRHLGILETRGMVTAVSQRKRSGRGRPERVYALTSPASVAGLEPLTRALLGYLTRENEGSTARDKIKSVAKGLLGKTSVPSGQLTKRLLAAVQKLTTLNYKPHWEAKPQGPELVLGRCPYAAIVSDHPELCEMDALMLESMLGSSVELRAKLEAGPQGMPVCVFKIRQPALNR